MSRLRYLVVRTVQTVVLIFLIMTFIWFLFRMMPGSYTSVMLGAGADQAAVDAFRERWGLDEPLYVQYYHYMINVLQLDMGHSLQYSTPVWDHVKFKIFNSFILIGPGITFAYILGSLIGTGMGTRKGSSLEEYGTIPVVFFGTMPEFFTSILLIVIFAGWLNLFPTSGMVSYEVASETARAAWWRTYLTASFAHHYVLPFTAVVLRYLFLPMLIMRTNVVESLGEDFFYYHRITGLPKIARFGHVIKHSILPVITLYPVSMTRALGGLVLIEVVFNWPGIGWALVQSVLYRDFPVTQFVFLIIAIWVILGNYLVDIVYTLIDPRISLD